MRCFPLEHFGPRREPIKLLRGLPPELLRLLDAALVHRLILCKALYMGLCGKLSRRSEHPVLPQARIQVRISFDRRHALTSVLQLQ